MLVLSRKPLESIVIGSNIRISIIKIDRNHVRIGIEAPDDVAIVRSELLGPEAATGEGVRRHMPVAIGDR